MRLVGLDFETANSNMASCCSLGITIFEDGELINNFEWLIKPPRDYFYFTNTYIHGINKDDVIDKKEFYEYYDELSLILKDSIIVAHNAQFDICVLNSVCDVYGLNHFMNEYIDTVKVSRRVYPELINHKLDTVSQYLNIDLDHHHAYSDSLACVMILEMAMQEKSIDDVYDFMKYINVCVKQNV